jgi:ATP-dependent RNA helicase DDX49/DBP8
MHAQGLLDLDSTLAPGFARARFLVLDEADRLLEPSFEEELGAALRVLPAQRQTVLFSATMTRTLVTLQKALLRDAYLFKAYEGLETASRLRQQYLFVPAKVKEVYLAHLLGTLGDHDVRSAIIFCSTCKVRLHWRCGGGRAATRHWGSRPCHR